MDDTSRLSEIERLKLGLFKWTSLAREGERHGLAIKSVRGAPDWNPELQEVRTQAGRDTGLLLIDEWQRRAWILVDVSLDYFDDDEGMYPNRAGE